MSYRGGILSPWFSADPVDKALGRMSDVIGDELLTLVIFHTPVDTGELAGSWKKQPTVIIANAQGHVEHRGGVFTEVDYAPEIEHGWGLWGPKHAKYEIKPKSPDGWLHWVNDAGQDVFAKRVMHPGAEGAHMVAIAVAQVEAHFGQIVAPIVYEWARATERQNHTGLATGRHA